MLERARLVVALAVVATGCDPAFAIAGRVAAAGSPLEGAEVTLTCNGRRSVLGTTDAGGRFGYHSIPGESPDCLVMVSKVSYAPRSWRLAEICTGHFGLSCTSATVAAELVPAR